MTQGELPQRQGRLGYKTALAKIEELQKNALEVAGRATELLDTRATVKDHDKPKNTPSKGDEKSFRDSLIHTVRTISSPKPATEKRVKATLDGANRSLDEANQAHNDATVLGELLRELEALDNNPSAAYEQYFIDYLTWIIKKLKLSYVKGPFNNQFKNAKMQADLLNPNMRLATEQEVIPENIKKGYIEGLPPLAKIITPDTQTRSAAIGTLGNQLLMRGLTPALAIEAISQQSTHGAQIIGAVVADLVIEMDMTDQTFRAFGSEVPRTISSLESLAKSKLPKEGHPVAEISRVPEPQEVVEILITGLSEKEATQFRSDPDNYVFDQNKVNLGYKGALQPDGKLRTRYVEMWKAQSKISRPQQYDHTLITFIEELLTPSELASFRTNPITFNVPYNVANKLSPELIQKGKFNPIILTEALRNQSIIILEILSKEELTPSNLFDIVLTPPPDNLTDDQLHIIELKRSAAMRIIDLTSASIYDDLERIASNYCEYRQSLLTTTTTLPTPKGRPKYTPNGGNLGYGERKEEPYKKIANRIPSFVLADLTMAIRGHGEPDDLFALMTPQEQEKLVALTSLEPKLIPTAVQSMDPGQRIERAFEIAHAILATNPTASKRQFKTEFGENPLTEPIHLQLRLLQQVDWLIAHKEEIDLSPYGFSKFIEAILDKLIIPPTGSKDLTDLQVTLLTTLSQALINYSSSLGTEAHAIITKKLITTFKEISIPNGEHSKRRQLLKEILGHFLADTSQLINLQTGAQQSRGVYLYFPSPETRLESFAIAHREVILSTPLAELPYLELPLLPNPIPLPVRVDRPDQTTGKVSAPDWLNIGKMPSTHSRFIPTEAIGSPQFRLIQVATTFGANSQQARIAILREEIKSLESQNRDPGTNTDVKRTVRANYEQDLRSKREELETLQSRERNLSAHRTNLVNEALLHWIPRTKDNLFSPPNHDFIYAGWFSAGILSDPKMIGILPISAQRELLSINGLIATAGDEVLKDGPRLLSRVREIIRRFEIVEKQIIPNYRHRLGFVVTDN